MAWCASLLGGPTYSVTAHAHELFRKDADRSILRTVLGGAAFAVAVSQFSAEFLLQELALPSERVTVIRNGIDLDRFPVGQGEREPGTIAAVGRLVEKKGFLHLIRACAQLRDEGLLRRCDILGEGEQRPSLEAEIRRHRLEKLVRLPGAASPMQVAETMRQCSAVVHPAVTTEDGNTDVLPTVLLEALASGAPVVASRLAGIPEIVTPEVGVLTPPGDPTALAVALGDLLQDQDRTQQLGRQARLRAEQKFNLHHAAARLRSHFPTDPRQVDRLSSQPPTPNS